MTKLKISAALFCLLLVCPMPATSVRAEPLTNLKPDTRCPVCGMFVVKYTSWMAQIVLADGSRHTFDGVKDMLAYYFEPGRFGGPAARDAIRELWVKDYYSLDWLDGRKAFFVIGSDTYGPMGHEFVPFGAREAAATFLKDHKGKKILAFDEIDKKQVDSLRTGSVMKH